MPRKAHNIPCTHTAANGAPCRAWAVKGTDPPACSAHAGRNVGAGAPEGNQNATSHGFYARTLTEQELADLVSYAADMTLDDEIACARVALRRVLTALTDTDRDTLTIEEFTRLAALALQATRTVALLLRDRRALTGDSADGISGAIAQALDELSIEWGREL